MISGIVIIDRTVVNRKYLGGIRTAFLSKRIDIMVIVVPVGQADAISVGYAMSALNVRSTEREEPQEEQL